MGEAASQRSLGAVPANSKRDLPLARAESVSNVGFASGRVDWKNCMNTAQQQLRGLRICGRNSSPHSQGRRAGGAPDSLQKLPRAQEMLPAAPGHHTEQISTCHRGAHSVAVDVAWRRPLPMEGLCRNRLRPEWSLQWDRRPRGAAACSEPCGAAPERWACGMELCWSLWEACGDQFKKNSIPWEILTWSRDRDWFLELHWC